MIWVVPLALTAFALGLWLGFRGVVAWRIQVYRRVAEAIDGTEHIVALTSDRRIVPEVPLNYLYALRSDLRLSRREEQRARIR